MEVVDIVSAPFLVNENGMEYFTWVANPKYRMSLALDTSTVTPNMRVAWRVRVHRLAMDRGLYLSLYKPPSMDRIYISIWGGSPHGSQGATLY